MENCRGVVASTKAAAQSVFSMKWGSSFLQAKNLTKSSSYKMNRNCVHWLRMPGWLLSVFGWDFPLFFYAAAGTYLNPSAFCTYWRFHFVSRKKCQPFFQWPDGILCLHDDNAVVFCSKSRFLRLKCIFLIRSFLNAKNIQWLLAKNNNQRIDVQKGSFQVRSRNTKGHWRPTLDSFDSFLRLEDAQKLKTLIFSRVWLFLFWFFEMVGPARRRGAAHVVLRGKCNNKGVVFGGLFMHFFNARGSGQTTQCVPSRDLCYQPTSKLPCLTFKRPKSCDIICLISKKHSQCDAQYKEHFWLLGAYFIAYLSIYYHCKNEGSTIHFDQGLIKYDEFFYW